MTSSTPTLKPAAKPAKKSPTSPTNPSSRTERYARNQQNLRVPHPLRIMQRVGSDALTPQSSAPLRIPEKSAQISPRPLRHLSELCGKAFSVRPTHPHSPFAHLLNSR